MKPYSLAERIRELRELRDLSQVELGEKAGIDKGHIARIELGHITEPKLEMLQRLAKGLDVSLREVADPAWYAREDAWTTMRRLLTENRRMSSAEKRSFQTLLEPWFRGRR